MRVPSLRGEKREIPPCVTRLGYAAPPGMQHWPTLFSPTLMVRCVAGNLELPSCAVSRSACESPQWYFFWDLISVVYPVPHPGLNLAIQSPEAGVQQLCAVYSKEIGLNPRAPAGAAYLSRRRVDNHRVNFPDKSVGERDSTRLKAYRSKVVITALRVFPRTPHLSPHEHLATRESIPRRIYASLSIEAKWSSRVKNQCIPTPRTRTEVRNGYGKRAGGLLPPNDRKTDEQKGRKEGRGASLAT